MAERELSRQNRRRSCYDVGHSYSHSDSDGAGCSMKTVQMTLDAELVSAVDRTARRLGTSRSAFTRDALRAALDRLRARELEQRHREGYTRKPVRRREFSVWEREQVWTD